MKLKKLLAKRKEYIYILESFEHRARGCGKTANTFFTFIRFTYLLKRLDERIAREKSIMLLRKLRNQNG